MCVKIFVIVLISTMVLLGCNNNNRESKHQNLVEVKDTINVVDIVSDFDKRLRSTGIGVHLQFFDKKYQRISRLNKGDTLFVKVDYISDTFVDLAKNHRTELYHASGDFKLLDKDVKNNYKIVVGTKADTIQIDVFLLSDKYIFNDYYLKNGKVKYQLTDKIFLCRLSELVKN